MVSTPTKRPPQVVLRVSDLARSLRFYRDLPDFAVTEPSNGLARVEGPGGVPLLLASPAAALAPDQGLSVSPGLAPHAAAPDPDPSLAHDPDAGLDPARHACHGVPVAAHGAWVYLHRPGLANLAALLAARDLTTGEPIQPYPGYRHLLLPDPDGYLLAFWESLPIADEQILELYRTGPGRLKSALAGLDDRSLDLTRVPGKWSIRQIVHHLVDSDLATFQVIRLALALSGRQVHPDVWEPDDWMAGLRCGDRPVGPVVTLFTADREWVLEAVSHLPGALDRWVTWPSGYRAEVRDLLRQTGGHAIHHIIQVEETRRSHGC